jgi:NTE family protein
VIIYLSFSGGGTRAAAFAYGVLEELRNTQISSNGGLIPLLEEVDTISGVSGGSFPAAYYGLYGDRIFEEFEERFLKKNVQGALLRRALLPWNLVGLMTPWVSRSDLAGRYYDEHVFDGATFSDLREAPGPRVHINATDLSSGFRFTFNQVTFDAICSDLEGFPISTAVAASSAVPVVLSPIAMENHAGTCGYVPPAWIADVLENDETEPRREYAARNFLSLTDRNRKRFIHLVDGGISDNLGLRAAIDFMAAAGGAEGARKIRGIAVPDHIAVIVVNAETDPDPTIDLSLASPSFAMLMSSVSGAQIRRYNFETLLLTQEMIQRAASELSTPERPVGAHMINVSFDGIADVAERRYYKRLPTSFKLDEREVDDLREAGRRLLRESGDFQELVKALR